MRTETADDRRIAADTLKEVLARLEEALRLSLVRESNDDD